MPKKEVINGSVDKVSDGITDIDFSHDNPMWRIYQLSMRKK
ncbi:hypothetical protein MKY14_13810 [Paenibacillus sp. FSL R5-0887]